MAAEIGHGFRQVQNLKFRATRKESILSLRLFGSDLFPRKTTPIAFPIRGFRRTEMLKKRGLRRSICDSLHGFSITVPSTESSMATDSKESETDAGLVRHRVRRPVRVA